MVNTFIITGNTWSSRDVLKHLGGRWVPHLHAWLLPDYERDSVQHLRDQMGFEVHLVTLPIDLPISSKAGADALARAATSPTHSPTPHASHAQAAGNPVR
jgi:hypothetical protein